MTQVSPVSGWLAPSAVALCWLLHHSASLPGPGQRLLAACTGALCLALAAWLAARSSRLAGWGALAGLLLLLGTSTVERAGNRLADRLSPALEGVPLRIEGVIDALPSALPQTGGWRFGFSPEHCQRLPESAWREARAQRHAIAPDPAQATCEIPPRLMLSWTPASELARLLTSGPQPAERWVFIVKLRRPHASVNFSAFDRELRSLEEGLGGSGTVAQGQRMEDMVPAFGPLVERLRARARDALIAAAGSGEPRAAGVLAALAVGDQAAIPALLWTAFNRTGVGHLMSISGLHVTMIGALGGWVAGSLWRSRPLVRLGAPLLASVPQIRRLATVLTAFVYAGLAGWGIPAQRTCFMLATAMALAAWGRLGSLATALGAAAFAILCLDPWAPLSAGFWLSFGAVAALVWTHQGARRDGSRWQHALWAAVRTQSAATLALLPLGGLFFGSVSLIGPLVNVVAIPLVTLFVTPFALLATLGALLWPHESATVLAPFVAVLGQGLDALEAISTWPGAAYLLPRPEGLTLILALIAAGLLLAPWGVPGRWLGGLCFLPFLASSFPAPGPGELWITALDVGQGSAVVVQSDGRTLVYDTGPGVSQTQDAGAQTVLPWLQSVGVRTLDHLVVSHLDDDHSGGARSLLQALPPRRFSSSLPPQHPLVQAAPAAEPCKRGESWSWGETQLEWLHPVDPSQAPRRSPTNAVSCVLRIEHPAGVVLLTGDIEAAQERQLLAERTPEQLRADVLLVPHHGSRSSSLPTFIDAVAPRWALVQAAYRSRFDHPHPQVMRRYLDRGITVLRSDADGAVQIRLRVAGEPEIIRARSTPQRYWRIPVGREGSPPD